ncbi:MAG: NADPH-dependent FMN reductase [Acetobacteraceae bacterium]
MTRRQQAEAAHGGDDERLTIPVLLGSVRRDRQGIRAARFIVNALTAHGHEPVLVDPLVLQLPLLDRMYKEYPKGAAPDVLERLATLYRRADGFIVVSAEYNNGIPPALKNLLDHFLEEYFWRSSGILCYSAGQFGGVARGDAIADDARRTRHAQRSVHPADPAHPPGARRGGQASGKLDHAVDRPVPGGVRLVCAGAEASARSWHAVLMLWDGQDPLAIP